MLTNFFRIDLPFEDFDIQRLAYSEEQLWELRQKHNSICSFFRNEVSPEAVLPSPIASPMTYSLVHRGAR